MKNHQSLSRTNILIIAGALLCIGAFFAFVAFKKPAVKNALWNDPSLESATLSDKDASISVSIARTPAQQEQGLSDTDSLAPNAGKLFVFSKLDTYGFWMKDMRYPLDLVWIDASHRIVDITSNVSPASYPEVFYPNTAVQYVLEVNAGFSTAHSLSLGDVVDLKK